MTSFQVFHLWLDQVSGCRMNRSLRLFVIAQLGALFACSQPSPGSADAGPIAPPGSCDVPAMLTAAKCTACHSGTMKSAGLDFTVDQATLAAQLLDLSSSATACAGHRVIDSRDPATSTLLTATSHAHRQVPTACSLVMAPGNPPDTDALAQADVACLETWVNTLTVGRTSDSFEAVPLPDALAKLKLLVHGGPVTATELATATADPNTIPTLVDGWTKRPEFIPKLRSFLGTALQQDSVGAAKETLGFPTAHFSPSDALRSALARSFVDTATDLVLSGSSFTQVVTTHQRSLTTAELVLIAYANQTSAEIEVPFKVRFVGPAKVPKVPATLTKVGDVWELSGAADDGQTCRLQPPNKGDIPDPQIMSSAQFLAMLFGRVQCRGPKDLVFAGPVTLADHDDARVVSLETTTGTAVNFTEVAKLRALQKGASIRLRSPRPGFFGTSVFLDNWPTNKDNAFRVTVNQTVAVALGTTFSMGDSTPNAAEGIDAKHAEPSSPCYRCHRLLDPTRAFLSNGMDTSYRVQTAPPAPATFAFFGASRTGATADDFARALVEHPRFATAWVLRVCSWANSRACTENEPGVADLAASFRASGYDFRKLVVDTLSAPLVTGLSGSILSVAPAVSITRRRHLCAALQVRLGHLVDDSGVCSSAPDALARGVPDDAFARNQPEFIQTSDPGMFHSAAMARVCEALAPVAVTQLFASSDVAGSTKKLVEVLMGLPPNHPRHNGVVASLAQHVSEVVAQGGTADEAMQSAFVVACSSPDVSGAGL